MEPTHDQSRVITFEYKKHEKSFKVHRKLPYENLLHVVKINFGLPDDAAVVLFDPVANCSIAPLATTDLWAWNDSEIPKYRLIVRSETNKRK